MPRGGELRSLLLLSNSTNYGQSFLEHAVAEIADALGGRRSLVFVPFAMSGVDQYTARVADVLADYCDVAGAHVVGREGIMKADCIFIGGGNTWRLLATLRRLNLLDLIAGKVRDGALYLGSSAGTNVACPTIRTTNDMPIVENSSLAALGLVPFQINPHYIDSADTPTHMGETRETRLNEFLEENDVPVVGLREGAWLRISGDAANLGGKNGALLFMRNMPATELESGQELSWLLNAQTRFDDHQD
jgi:dipeptidase E